MKNLKTILDEIFAGYDSLKVNISEACKQIPVANSKINRDDLEKELQKYLYPQLMKANVIEYKPYVGNNGFKIITEKAEITVIDGKVTIEWDPRMILLTKRHIRTYGINQSEPTAQ